jgi:hypothetical protein
LAILPFPRPKAVPPITVAAIDSSSKPSPSVAWPETALEVKTKAANPISAPCKAHTPIFVLATETPEYKAAS